MLAGLIPRTHQHPAHQPARPPALLAEETFFPPALFLEPPEVNMDTARQEAEMVLFPVVEDLLRKTGNMGGAGAGAARQPGVRRLVLPGAAWWQGWSDCRAVQQDTWGWH